MREAGTQGTCLGVEGVPESSQMLDPDLLCATLASLFPH